MKLVTTKKAFRGALDVARAAGRTVGLVPTMGALHPGHLSLMSAARAHGAFLAVTVFVNPLQFGDPNDLSTYPRHLEEDLRLCDESDVGVVFAPTEAEMYPSGAPSTTVVPGPLGSRLEGESRDGHFTGVATIVTKLLSLANPCVAYFGEKDFQQLVIIRRLVCDLDLATEIVSCPTVREPDGLATSSRNRRLTPVERAAAASLWDSLDAGRRLVEAGERDPEVVAGTMEKVLRQDPLVMPAYAVVADPGKLTPLRTIDAEVRLLVAARVGDVRLIDNLSADPPVGSARDALARQPARVVPRLN